jgi:hypothetical protein
LMGDRFGCHITMPCMVPAIFSEFGARYQLLFLLADLHPDCDRLAR